MCGLLHREKDLVWNGQGLQDEADSGSDSGSQPTNNLGQGISFLQHIFPQVWVTLYTSLHHLFPIFSWCPQPKQLECFMLNAECFACIFFIYYNNALISKYYHYLHLTEEETDTQANVQGYLDMISWRRDMMKCKLLVWCMYSDSLWQLVKKKSEIKDLILFLLPWFQWAKPLKLIF